jgi:hypothetical protein
MDGEIVSVVIYQDHIRYRVWSWVGPDTRTFEFARSDFDVIPNRGPQPMQIGFAQRI